MNALLDNLVHYLRRTLRIELQPITRWPGAKAIPRHLNDAYRIYQTQLLDLPCLLVLLTGESEPTPAELKKHLQLIEAKAGFPAVYVQHAIRAGQRQRLIDQHIPFAVPDKQLFLPPLGIDLREHYLAQAKAEGEALSPSSQLVLLGQLLGLWPREIDAKRLTRLLGYSAMTMSRIKRELHTLTAEDAPQTAMPGWKQALPYLRSPLRTKVWVRHPPEQLRRCPLAGLSALASRTMLSPPTQEVRAIGEQAWRDLLRQGLLQIDTEPVPGALELELWKYNPMLLVADAPDRYGQPDLGRAAMVDPYSLYLTLRDHADERVALALDEMMEPITA